MPRFMITRTLPPLTPEQLEVVRHTSTRVCNELGVKWIRSHLTADGKHTFCEYDADDEEAIREHSRISGIPFDEIIPLGMELGPASIR
jgi:hypothetical protein